MARFLTDGEFNLLMRAISSRDLPTTTRDRTMFYVLGRTGLRRSEVLSLRFQDLKLDARPPFLWVTTLKRKARTRDTVLLERRAAFLLKTWKDQGWAKFVSNPSLLVRFVFPTRGGNRLGARALTKLFRFYADRAKLPDEVTLHSLRHYRATELYRKTQDLRFVQQELRHRSISSTGIYLHTSPEQAEKYLKRMEEDR